MALATFLDVQTRVMRELTPEEQELAEVLLGDVERRLATRIPGLLTTVDPVAIVSVEAEAVARVLRNPGGYRQETEGEYSYSVDVRAAAGFLTVLDDEWADLGLVADGAFTIMSTPPSPGSRGPLNRWELNL